MTLKGCRIYARQQSFTIRQTEASGKRPIEGRTQNERNMKPSARLLCVFVAAVFVRSVVGDVESDVNCTTVPEEGKSMYETFRMEVDDCGYAHGYRRPENNATEAEIRAEIVPYCGRLAEHRECFDTAVSRATACLDENQKTQLRLYRDYMLIAYEAACAHNGEDLVYVLTAIRQLQEQGDFLITCYDNARATVDAEYVADENGDIIREYKIIQKYLEYLQDHKGKAEEQDKLIDMEIAKKTKVLDMMKCNHEGNDVLCKTIVD